MYQMINRCHPFVLLVILSAYVSRSSAQPPDSVLRIDPAVAIGGKVADIFDSISYIPLETIPESVFGKIDELAITDDYYIILDYDTNSILFFFKNGKFHCKIKGNAIARTSRPFGIPSFALNRHRKELSFRLDSVTMAVYDFNGEKVREQKALPSSYHCYVSDDVQVFSSREFPRRPVADTTGYEVKWLRQENVIGKALPYPLWGAPLTGKDMIRGLDSHFYNTDDDTVVYYTRPYDYTVYQVGPASFYPVYRFIIPAAISLPADFSTNPVYKDHRMDYILRQRRGVVFIISHVYRLGTMLFFELESLGDNSNSSFIYSLNSGTLVGIDHIEPDSSNYLLPVFHNQSSLTFSFATKNFLTVDGPFIYTGISAADMLSVPHLKNSEALKKDPLLYTYFQHVLRTDNPVIIRLRPKQSL
jgi:hypothetical protein